MQKDRGRIRARDKRGRRFIVLLKYVPVRIYYKTKAVEIGKLAKFWKFALHGGLGIEAGGRGLGEKS